MAHGAPDWGGLTPTAITSSVQDAGELAARTRSICLYDRRGNVILAEDFSGGAQIWQFVSSGAGETYEWTTAYRRCGLGATQVNVVAAANSYGQVGLYAPLCVLSRVGYEASISMQADISYLQLVVTAFRATAPSQGYLKIDRINNVIQVYDDAVGWVTLDDTSWLFFNPQIFSSMKLVIDLTTGKYVRFLLNGKSYDLSSYSLYAAGAGNPQALAFFIEAHGDGTHASFCVIDDVILTVSEP